MPGSTPTPLLEGECIQKNLILSRTPGRSDTNGRKAVKKAEMENKTSGDQNPGVLVGKSGKSYGLRLKQTYLSAFCQMLPHGPACAHYPSVSRLSATSRLIPSYLNEVKISGTGFPARADAGSTFMATIATPGKKKSLGSGGVTPPLRLAF
jgi:hypothetical protein